MIEETIVQIEQLLGSSRRMGKRDKVRALKKVLELVKFCIWVLQNADRV